MWKAIRDNTRRSRLLIGAMALVLAGLGALGGWTLFGPEAVWAGVLVAAGMWVALFAIAHWGGERFVLFSSGAREIQKDDAPQLWNVVEEMVIASGLGRMPRLYVLDTFMQNAFAAGRSPETARIVVTDGLVRHLSREELQGVIAHEIGHIRNQDIRFMTHASVMLGAVTMLADSIARYVKFGAGRRSRARGSPHTQIAFLALAFVAAALAPIFARILYMACSRSREFLADASAARFTRYPEGLASALEKISRRVGVTRDDIGLRALAPMYIVNPLSSRASGWFSTHPSTEMRVRILRSMGGAGWKDYERAYRGALGSRERCLEPALWENEKPVPLRDAGPETGPGPSGEEARIWEVADLLDREAGFLPFRCSCGLRMKLPPEFDRDAFECPRCGRSQEVPRAAHAGSPAPDAPLEYRRRGEGWDSFRCSCGRVVHLSPAVRVPSVRCSRCGTRIRIA